MSTSPRWSRSSTIIPAHVPKTGAVEAADRLVEPVEAHQPREGRRLAARDHEPVEPVELLGLAHLDHVGAEPPQHRRVLAEVALHGEHADPKRLHAFNGNAAGRLVSAAAVLLALASAATWGIADFSRRARVAARADDPGDGDLAGGGVRGAARRARGRRRRHRRPLVRARRARRARRRRRARGVLQGALARAR